MKTKTIISGAGISGLLAALILCREGNSSQVYLVDKNDQPGGLLRRFQYEKWGDFDFGMHNVLETGIEELDKLIFGLLPEADWQILSGSKRDLAGVYLNGHLQRNTPFIDLRTLSDEERLTCTSALLSHLDKAEGNETITTGSAYDYAVSRFGLATAQRTIIPALEKIHKRDARDLDFMASVFTPMTRLAFCDERLSEAFSLSEYIRDRVAWSDQRTLPDELSSGRKGYYPVKYGIYRLVDAIVNELRQSGVQLLMGTEIISVGNYNGHIDSVTVRTGLTESTLNNVSNLIWAANASLLARYLGVDFSRLTYDKPLQTVICNLVVDRLPEQMGDLYYFFCYDPSFNTYRLTNYYNYCAGAARNGGYPISLELLVKPEFSSTNNWAQIAEKEFRQFKISAPETKILFSKSETLSNGFPMPSSNNISVIRHIREQVKGMNIKNLITVGVLAEDNLFFQTDVLKDTYLKMKNL